MIKDLVKIYFKGNGGLPMFQSMMQAETRKKKNIKSKKSSSIGTPILFGFVIILFAWMIFGNFTQMLTIYGVNGAFWMLQIMAALMAFFFTLTSVDNILVKGSDLPMLFALPVARNKVFISRFVILFIEVFTEVLITFVPFIVASALKVQFSLMWYLLLLVDLFVLPMAITMLLALISFLSTRVRIIAKLRSALYILVMIATIYIMISSQGAMSQQEAAFYEVYQTKAIVSSDLLLSATLAILGAIALSVAFYFICSKLTNGFVNIEEKGVKARRDKGEISYKANSVNIALLQREIRIVGSDSAFYVELIMESVMPLFLLVIYAVMGIAGDLWSVVGQFANSPIMHLSVCGIFIFFYIMNMASSTSVSREGKDFDYSKIYPVSVEQRINAKVIFHELLVTPVAVILLVAALLYLKASPFLIIAMVIFLPVFNAWMSLVGLKLDYRKPNLDWERPQTAVKQNINGVFGMLFGLVFSIIIAAPIVLSMIFFNSYILALVVEILVLSALLPLVYRSTVKTAKTAYLY